jgi:hypothetical protein
MALTVTYRYSPFPGGMIHINRPDLGMVGAGYNFDTLLNQIRAYRRANAIPAGISFEDEVATEVCRVLGGNGCTEINRDPREPHPNRRLGVADVLHGSEFFAKQAALERPKVPVEEAIRRASICRNCKYNSQWARPCASWLCAGVGALISSVGQLPPTGMDDVLHSCKICGCLLRVAVHYDLELQQSVLTPKQKDEFRFMKEQGLVCWKAENI